MTSGLAKWTFSMGMTTSQVQSLPDSEGLKVASVTHMIHG